jgi:hypothetical protein
MRITSPPMLLGRKLLKKVAARKEDQRPERENQMLSAKEQPPRHALAKIITQYNASADRSHGVDAFRATDHRRAMSTRENSSHSSAMLTVPLSAVMMRLRVREPVGVWF